MPKMKLPKFNAKRALAKEKVAMKKAQRKRFVTETKRTDVMERRGQKMNYRAAKRAAKNAVPIEKHKMDVSLAKHGVWATTVSDILGKGTAAITPASKVGSAATVDQNIKGGLTSTEGRRSDDDYVDEGGLVA